MKTLARIVAIPLILGSVIATSEASAQVALGEPITRLIVPGQEPGDPLSQMPAGQRLISPFGERPVFSPDGKKIAFIGDSYGDAFEYEVATGQVRNLTAGVPHRGFLRIHYLKDGSFLLLGPRLTGATRAETREKHIELFWLNSAANRPPVPLGVTVFEGIATSRTSNRVAWGETRPVGASLRDVKAVMMRQADVVVANGTARLAKIEDIHSFDDCIVEAQDYLPGDKALTMPCYHFGAQYPNGVRTEVFWIDLASHAVTRYPWGATAYGEIEGIFPDGKNALVECSDNVKAGMDLCVLELKAERPRVTRLTHVVDHGRFKFSNPVVSPDGKRVAVSIGPADTAEPGMGLGIVLIDLVKGR